VGLPDAKTVYSLGRETDIWEALTERWGIQGIDANLYQSTLVRPHGWEVHFGGASQWVSCKINTALYSKHIFATMTMYFSWIGFVPCPKIDIVGQPRVVGCERAKPWSALRRKS
jgi:hypothetical protein